jgi:hypothetical protein
MILFQLQPVSAVTIPEQTPTAKEGHSTTQTGVQVSASPISDLFGYSYDDTNPPSWVDITSDGTELIFSDTDDSFFGPVDIGFNFKFYENTYTQLYVSTNGLISFGMGTDNYENGPVPSDLTPHNFIAPFWDDLILDTGSQVFYRLADNDSYFVVEWYQVPRIGTQDRLTFEVILEPNGDITFQYQELNGILDQATVGIEDQHGVDGLLYLYNAPGVRVDQAIEIIRPTASPRAKVYPLYNSDFTSQRKTVLDFTVRNSGDDANDQDTYDLSWTPNDSDWSISFRDIVGNPLADTDSDLVVDTGPIDQGADFEVQAVIEASPEYQVGDYIQFNIQVTSSNDGSRSASTHLQAAAPAPFVQVLLDDVLGMGLKLLWSQNQINARTSELHLVESSLNEPGVISLANGYFLYSWENTQFKDGKLLTKLEYMIFYPFGEVYQAITDLTNHDSAEERTLDQDANFISTSGGYIGGVWVRSLKKAKQNDNVHLSILDANGQVSSDQLNLTSNNDWRGPGDLDIPYYNSPKISATDDGRFVIAWVDDRLLSGGSTSDVVYAVYNQSGDPVSTSQVLTGSEPGGVLYTNPTLVSLEGGQALLAYTIDAGGASSSLGYMIITSDGTIAQGETLIPDSQGSSPDGVRLSTGQVLLAWHDTVGGEVGYAIINDSTHTLESGPHSIAPPDGRTPNEVSVTSDEDGHGIITWGDEIQDDHLYYALVDGEGLLVTPEMIFLKGSCSDPEVKTSSSGMGIAPYQGFWQMFMPMLIR